MQNHYYDPTHPLRPYTHSAPANPGSLPPENATRLEPEHEPGCWLCWNGVGWEFAEDHRGQEGYLDGQPHTIKDLGPFPAGWSDTPPPPSEAEQVEARRAEILAALDEIDRQSIRPLRAIAKGLAAPADIERLVDLEAQAKELRAELAQEVSNG